MRRSKHPAHFSLTRLHLSLGVLIHYMTHTPQWVIRSTQGTNVEAQQCPGSHVATRDLTFLHEMGSRERWTDRQTDSQKHKTYRDTNNTAAYHAAIEEGWQSPQVPLSFPALSPMTQKCWAAESMAWKSLQSALLHPHCYFSFLLFHWYHSLFVSY